MKKFLLALLVAVAAPAAFGQINIDPPTRSFTKDGGGGSILTSGSGTWTATSNVSWITITPRTSGNAGESCIYVVGSNFSADTRQGVITIGGKTHTVTQTGYNATLSPSSATVDLNGATGTISITVDAGVAWSAVSNASWVTVTPGSGTSSGSVSYTVAPYGGVTTRTTSLTVAGKTFSITQTGTDVNISPKSSEKAYSSDIVQVAVTALSTTTWNVTPNASWISVVDDGNGFGDSTITLAVGTNPSFLERTGTVTIGSATFTIIQAGTPNPTLDIIPKEATADPVGAYGNIAVLATPDGPWTAQSMSPWIVISQGASGAGNGNIQYVASANPNLTNRTGTIRVNPPVFQPTVDLTWLLLAHVNGNSATDISGWGRNLSGMLATRFNGLSPRTMSGQSFARGADDTFSICLQFELGDLNTINRLLEVTRGAASYSTLYVDTNNQLVFRSASETLTTSLAVQAGVTYQVVLTADASNQVRVYASARGGSEIPLVGTRSFAAAPFPANYVTPAFIKLGSAQSPTPGNLTNAALNDLRIYGRCLNAREAAAVYANAGTTNPYALAASGLSPAPVLQMKFEGSGVSALTNNPLFMGSATNWSRSTDRFGLSNRAVQSTNTGRLALHAGSFAQVSGSYSWSQARTNANARGGRLAVVDSSPKQQVIASLGLTGWIGLNDETTEASWKWVNGNSLSYQNWGPNEPNGGISGMRDEDYAQVVPGGEWIDNIGTTDRYILETTNPSVTSCYWVRFDSFPSTNAVIQTNIETALVLEVVSGPSLRLKRGGFNYATFAAPLVTNTWHHIALAGASGGVTRRR